MIEQLNLLFGKTTDDLRDLSAMRVALTLLETKQIAWGGYATPEITHYCLGVSIDDIHQGLPVVAVGDLRTIQCVTIYQLIASINRLVARGYLVNDEEFEVIHLDKKLLTDLHYALTEEEERLRTNIDELTGNNLVLIANIELATSALNATR